MTRPYRRQGNSEQKSNNRRGVGVRGSGAESQTETYGSSPRSDAVETLFDVSRQHLIPLRFPLQFLPPRHRPAESGANTLNVTVIVRLAGTADNHVSANYGTGKRKVVGTGTADF
jgi:hypothetical protein